MPGRLLGGDGSRGLAPIFFMGGGSFLGRGEGVAASPSGMDAYLAPHRERGKRGGGRLHSSLLAKFHHALCSRNI